MFQSIQKGLETYKEKVEEHILEINRVAEQTMKRRARQKKQYRGTNDWSKEDLGAFNKRCNQLSGMSTALGLSDEEIKKNWEDVERKLGERK